MLRALLIFAFLAFATDSEEAADCKSEVNSAFDKLRQSKAFRMRTTIVNEQGSLRMTVDYVLPDRMHQTVALGASDPVELIVIGSKAWSNAGQGWAEMPDTYAAHVADQIKQSVAEPPPSDTDFVCLGDKELEGKSYAAYQALISAEPNLDPTVAALKGTRNVQTVYIDKATLLPERNIVTAGNSDEKRLFDGTFSFPPSLTIEPPAVLAPQ